MTRESSTPLANHPSWREDLGLISVLFACSLFLRTFFAHSQVFLSEYVRFRGTDAWYHLRLIENLLGHFPRGIDIDPYLLHPAGEIVAEAPLFDFLLAFIAWSSGMGQPSIGWVEILAAWYPAVLGALVTIPVYLSAHLLWGRPAGMVAAGLIAVLPGRFLERSMLGSTDHHVAEVLWSSFCLCFLLAALREARRAATGQGSGRPLLRSVVYSAAAGLALAAYMLSWRSASGLPVLLMIWVGALVVIDIRRRRQSLAWVAIPTLTVALTTVAPWLDGRRVPYRHAFVLSVAILGTAALVGAAHLLQKRRRYRSLFWLLVAGCAGALLSLVALPGPLEDLTRLVDRLAPSGWGLTVAEMRPLHVDDSVAQAMWREFSTVTVAGMFGLGLVLWRAFRESRPETLLLLVWSLTVFGASLAQRRFTYYLAVVMALLGAAAVSWVSSRVRRESSTSAHSLTLAAACAVLLVPNVGRAVTQASRPSGPGPAWNAAFTWLRSNSPEPFADPDYYVARYGIPGEDEASAPPPASYGVMSWWDRGFWLIRMAHRVPVANPKGHGIAVAASFYLEQDEKAGLQALKRAGARYVIVDDGMPIHQAGGSEIGLGSLHSMTVWDLQPSDRFMERFEYRTDDGQWRPIFYYYPSYFRSMAVRLQTFSGQAVVPRDSIWVVSFRNHLRNDGLPVRRVTRMKKFRSYEKAIDFLAQQAGDNHRLVSTDPSDSCVPLEALRHLRRVYPPTEVVPGRSPPVQIFDVDIAWP